MKLFVLLVLLFPIPLLALNWSVVGPCEQTPLFWGRAQINLSYNVVSISHSIFQRHQIPSHFVGESLNRLYGIPTQAQSVEMISETSFRAYGWCLAINERVVDSLPQETYLSHQRDRLTWFLGFATYENGVWSEMCVPAWTVENHFCS